MIAKAYVGAYSSTFDDSQLAFAKILGFYDNITNAFRWKIFLVVITLAFLSNDPRCWKNLLKER